jgi:hypothetical protein
MLTLQRHLSQCSDCAEELESIRSVKSVLSSLSLRKSREEAIETLCTHIEITPVPWYARLMSALERPVDPVTVRHTLSAVALCGVSSLIIAISIGKSAPLQPVGSANNPAAMNGGVSMSDNASAPVSMRALNSEQAPRMVYISDDNGRRFLIPTLGPRYLDPRLHPADLPSLDNQMPMHVHLAPTSRYNSSMMVSLSLPENEPFASR